MAAESNAAWNNSALLCKDVSEDDATFLGRDEKREAKKSNESARSAELVTAKYGQGSPMESPVATNRIALTIITKSSRAADGVGSAASQDRIDLAWGFFSTVGSARIILILFEHSKNHWWEVYWGITRWTPRKHAGCFFAPVVPLHWGGDSFSYLMAEWGDTSSKGQREIVSAIGWAEQKDWIRSLWSCVSVEVLEAILRNSWT